MARKIALIIEASDQHEQALMWLLKHATREAEANLRKPPADIDTLLTTLVIAQLDTYATQHQDEQGTRIRDALLTASADDCAKACEILKCEWP